MVAVGLEKAQHVHHSSWPDVPPVPDVSLAKYVLDRLPAGGDRTALVDGVSGERLSFRELVEWVREVSEGWLGKGLQEGDVVALVTPNTPLVPATFLAAVAAGATVTLANPLYTTEELQRHLTHSTACWVVAHPVCLSNVVAAASQCDAIKGIFTLGPEGEAGVEPLVGLRTPASPDWQPRPRSPADPVHLPYSSGTTGLPKGVCLSSSNWVAVLSTVGREEYLDIRNDDVVLGILPFFHVFGLGICVGALSLCATVVTLPRFIPQVFLTAIQTHKVTVVPLVPPLAIFLAKHEVVDKFDLSSVREIQCGAAPLQADVQQLLTHRLGKVRVRQGFGMTETTLAVFTGSVEQVGAVGSLVPHCQAKIVDMETGDSLGPDQDGELCVRGPIITQGYFRDEAATAELIDSDGWLHTGDVGRYSADSTFYVVDRIKELIKYKGYQVAPAELEGLLVTHEDVADAAVVGVADEEAGDLPRAYLVPRPGHTIVPDTIVSWVHERVAPHKRLRGGVVAVDAVPRSPAGKILRRKLREQANSVQ